LLVQRDYSFLSPEQKHSLLSHFGSVLKDKRKELIEQVLAQRSRYITLVFEDIENSQNASAVIRTAEAMGLQDVHVIENNYSYTLNKGVLKGSFKWINIFRHAKIGENITPFVYDKLKKSGYRIYALAPSARSKSIFEIDPGLGKIALVFGNEHRGLSADALSLADEQIHIPMFGFTMSYNLSVSAAISLQTLMPVIRKPNINWQLTAEEKLELRLDWYRKSLPRGHILEQELLRSINMQILSNKKA